MYLAISEWVNQRRSIPLPFTKGAETCLLCQQGIGRCRNQVFKNGANSLSSSKCCPKAPPLFSSPPSDYPTSTTNQVNRSGGHYELTEPHALRLWSWVLTTVPNWGTSGASHPAGFSASNNEAEYEVILSGLDLALALSVSKLRIYSDSQLWHADALAGIAASLPIKEAILLPIHVQANPSVVEDSTCNTIEANQTDDQEWTHNIAEYLRAGTLPEDPKQAHKIRVQAARFTLIGDTCTNDLSQGLIFAVLGIQKPRYYWPTMKKDAAAYVQKCDKCQRYAPIPHVPSAALKSVSSPWPFAQWAWTYICKHQDKDVTKFVWNNIVCRFGIPQIIIADNGPQFDSIAFRNFCSELNIRNSYSTPRYPQSNGQAEATNKTLINALKKRLEQAKGKWVEELPGVLWAYRTTPGRPTGNTPFALTYGMDAVIPTEIGLPYYPDRCSKTKRCQHGTRKKFGLGRRSQRKRGHPDGRLSTKGINALQSKSQAHKLQKWYAST
ncbi:Pro-Pol polyprotein [Vitis vinifera]|uniref:Pro-Pol polyprotein n=1 Tax=Vitis vinifera TaxID=29760 RepID=A0A438FDQ9_VITVI|nr:Pro-Pol polyprotein [Vitis vinifera]